MITPREATHNAAITESILNIDPKEPQPGVVNLDAFRGFCFYDPPKGTFIGEMEMVKWLVRNRDGGYWKAKHGCSHGVTDGNCKECHEEEVVRLLSCPNCASLEAQNTELDQKLAQMERKLKSLTEAVLRANGIGGK